MLCKYYWIVLYTVHVTAFCLGGGAVFFRTRCSSCSLLAIARAQYHVTYLQWVDINHIFEIPDPYLSIHFATCMTF